MKSGIKIVMEFHAQDPASKGFMKLQDIIDIYMRDAFNEGLDALEAKIHNMESMYLSPDQCRLLLRFKRAIKDERG